MKKLSVIIVFSIVSTYSFGQTTVSKIENESLIRILNEFSLLLEDRTGEISIKVLEVVNAPGSADNASGEATSRLLIAVSEFDMFPRQSLFKFGDVYAPKVTSKHIDSSSIELVVEHGQYNQKKIESLVVSINRLVKK